jgi:hypothetical protein
MRLRDAIILASNEYDAECGHFDRDADLNAKAKAVLSHDYDEIEATTMIDDVLQGQTFMPSDVDRYVRQSIMFAFRLGMRVQRKLACPDVETSIFDQTEQTLTVRVQ